MFYSIGVLSGGNDERAKGYAATYAAKAPKDVEDGCIDLAGADLAECATEIVDANRESQRGESDLAAQWQAANWVAWAAIIAGMQLIATIVGLIYIKRTLDATLTAVADTGLATMAMKDANDIARLSLETVNRAWVTIQPGWEPFKRNMNRVAANNSIMFYAKIQNVGGTPALKTCNQTDFQFVEQGQRARAFVWDEESEPAHAGVLHLNSVQITPPHPITDEEFMRVCTTGGKVVISCIVRYYDIHNLDAFRESQMTAAFMLNILDGADGTVNPVAVATCEPYGNTAT